MTSEVVKAASFSPEQASEYIGVPLKTLDRWRREKRKIRFLKTGPVVRYSKEDLDAFLAKSVVDPVD